MYYWIFCSKEPVLYVVYVYIMTRIFFELKIEFSSRIYDQSISKMGTIKLNQ